MNWKPLVSQEDLLEIIESSKNRPQVIFKHSNSCSISSMAKMRLEDKWDLTGVDAHYLDLLSYRNISNQIAERLSVHHESPQLILLIDGECVYDASHFDITVEELKESLAYARR